MTPTTVVESARAEAAEFTVALAAAPRKAKAAAAAAGGLATKIARAELAAARLIVFSGARVWERSRDPANEATPYHRKPGSVSKNKPVAPEVTRSPSEG